jgi:uncharacterized protein (TIGR03089 family)
MELAEVIDGAALTETDRPLLTYYDDATGERTEVSARALGGWASRAAALLHEGCGLGPGCRAAVLLPPHWQTAAALFGAWAAGVAVSFRLSATAGLPAYEPGNDEPLDATFVTRRRLDSWLENVPEARHRFVLDIGAGAGPPPPADPPEGYRDFLTELRQYPDSLPAYLPARRSDAASVDGTTYGEWGALARALAESQGLAPGERLLVDSAEHEHPVYWLLAPLSVGGSVVLCANLDRTALDARVAAEGVTRIL